MKIYCSFCKDQLTKKDDIIEVEENVGFMHESCYHKWLSKQHIKRMVSYDNAIKKVKSMLKVGV